MKKYTTKFFLVLSYSGSEYFYYSYSFPDDFSACIYETSQENIGLPGNLSRCLEHLFGSEPVSACFCRNEIPGVISGVLKSCKEEGCSLQACNLLKGNSIRDHFLKIFCDSQNTFKKFD